MQALQESQQMDRTLSKFKFWIRPKSTFVHQENKMDEWMVGGWMGPYLVIKQMSQTLVVKSRPQG